jgi:UDP-N-acetylmuramate dehydrogenase
MFCQVVAIFGAWGACVTSEKLTCFLQPMELRGWERTGRGGKVDVGSKPDGGCVDIQENVLLGPMTTFGIGGRARFFVEARTEQDVAEAVGWAKKRELPMFVLGGGSNLLVRDEGFAGLVLHVAICGVHQDKPWSPDFHVGAGEVWDSFVNVAIEANCAGVECLAGIPGLVGGTPVQNVGAYGQEVAETIRQVRVLDRETMEFRSMDSSECGFRYRESVFNTTERGRYVVTAVVFLLRYGKPTLAYAELKKRFEGHGFSPQLREVADAVREIRREKGMLLVEGDADCRSAGSFFKNPMVEEGLVAGIAAAAGVAAVPHWPAGVGMVKLPAAWLLEKAGFVKGYGEGSVGISTKHTLALVNRGGATFADVERMEGEIVRLVRERFGVGLVREPVVLG